MRWNLLCRTLWVLTLGLGGAWFVRSYVIETVSVASGSMEPTLFAGSHYWVNRIGYRFHAPQRGDIVVFTSPVDPEMGMIKRVIAVSGDEIEIRHKQVFLNGERLDEPYAAHKRAQERLQGDDLGPLKIPADAVFVLGDNRDLSSDSSVWKDPKTGEPMYFLPTKNMKGKLIQFP